MGSGSHRGFRGGQVGDLSDWLCCDRMSFAALVGWVPDPPGAGPAPHFGAFYQAPGLMTGFFFGMYCTIRSNCLAASHPMVEGLGLARMAVRFCRESRSRDGRWCSLPRALLLAVVCAGLKQSMNVIRHYYPCEEGSNSSHFPLAVRTMFLAAQLRRLGDL